MQSWLTRRRVGLHRFPRLKILCLFPTIRVTIRRLLLCVQGHVLPWSENNLLCEPLDGTIVISL